MPKPDQRVPFHVDPPWWVQLPFIVVIGVCGSLLLAGFFGFLDQYIR